MEKTKTSNYQIAYNIYKSLNDSEIMCHTMSGFPSVLEAIKTNVLSIL